MDATDILLVVMRGLHAVAAAVWVGAVCFELLVVLPALGEKPPEHVLARVDAAMREIVQTSLIVFLISGALLTFERLSRGAAGSSRVGHDQRVSEGLYVLGGPLEPCGFDPVTGFWRDGTCRTGGQDLGVHAVCAVMTDEFLEYSRSVGNDLSTPRPEWGVPGLREGDRWCLCADRWQQALEAGVAPPVVLEATHALALEFSSLESLREYAFGD